MRILFSFAVVLWTVLGSSLYASEYSQPGFYDVEQVVLGNGMRVVLKPRHNARNVSVQLLVNVGHMNFPCGKRETAHFLEHLLFTGTDKHSEIELDEVIDSHGGSWNAETANTYTRYYIDIYSRNLDVALQTLHEIITRSNISQDNVEKSRKIIFRESGGKPSRFRQWLYQKEIIRPAIDRALNIVFPGMQYQCLELDNASSITRDEVLQAYRDYYVAGNMALVLVGDFEPADVKPMIAGTFGAMPKTSVADVKGVPLPAPFKPVNQIIEGRWHPLVHSEASIYLMYRTGGIYSKHYYALTVLESYFQTELYNRLRVELGMAYAPDAYTFMHDDFGALVFETDSELGDIEKNIKLIKDTIAQYQQGNLDQQRLDNVKHKILINAARGYESNSSFAEYYALTLEDLKRYGKYENYEDQIERVSMRDIRNASNAYLRDDNLVIAVVKPTLTYTQLYILLLFSGAMALLIAWRLARRIRLRRRT